MTARLSSPSPGAELSLDRLYTLSATGRVMSATLLDEDSVVTGRLCDTEATTPAPGADDEVRRLLAAAEVQATQSLEANRELLRSLAERLEEIETLEGDELDAFQAQAVPITVGTTNGGLSAPRPPPTAQA